MKDGTGEHGHSKYRREERHGELEGQEVESLAEDEECGTYAWCLSCEQAPRQGGPESLSSHRLVELSPLFPCRDCATPRKAGSWPAIQKTALWGSSRNEQG